MDELSARTRVSTACEACRAAKIKCMPSEQPGVCRKCLECKKECVSRTGPRTRRSRKQKLAQELADSQRPSAATPSRTFSIDFEVPSHAEVDDNFETLRDAHAKMMDSLLPLDLDGDQQPLDSCGMDYLPTPTPSSSNSQPIHELGAKPLFNRASAESLLGSFQSMLPHFPCIVLQPEATVSHLAATRPFVLLAILAAASGSRTLQGHTLYDEEFRKVLGMKFVAGGERSLELLQGILIYCAWYPYHLRPKNKQALHYMQMASDLIYELELEMSLGTMSVDATPVVDDHQLDCMRAYLGYSYAVSAFFVSRRVLRGGPQTLNPSTASTCCDVLERSTDIDGDKILAYLARFAAAVSDASEANDEHSMQSDQQRHLILLGLESQVRELQDRMPSEVADQVALRMAAAFTRFYLDAGALAQLPRPNTGTCPRRSTTAPSAAKLAACIDPLQIFLDYIVNLDHAQFLSFCGVDWTKLIIAIILALRLSFPLPEGGPAWDDGWARGRLRFGEFLSKMSAEPDLTSASRKVDVFSASRVVIGVVRDRYERRLAHLNAKAAAAETTSSSTSGCPMLDGSLDDYFPLWDAEFDVTSINAGASVGGIASETQPVFHDLWATMTMGWADRDTLL